MVYFIHYCAVKISSKYKYSIFLLNIHSILFIKYFIDIAVRNIKKKIEKAVNAIHSLCNVYSPTIITIRKDTNGILSREIKFYLAITSTLFILASTLISLCLSRQWTTGTTTTQRSTPPARRASQARGGRLRRPPDVAKALEAAAVGAATLGEAPAAPCPTTRTPPAAVWMIPVLLPLPSIASPPGSLASTRWLMKVSHNGHNPLGCGVLRSRHLNSIVFVLDEKSLKQWIVKINQ